MLIELREVEAHIQPEEILTKALQEGDIEVSTVVRACLYEESARAVLDALDHSDIEEYCQRHEIGTVVGLEAITTSLKSLSNLDKAQLLWLLLKCEG